MLLLNVLWNAVDKLIGELEIYLVGMVGTALQIEGPVTSLDEDRLHCFLES